MWTAPIWTASDAARATGGGTGGDWRAGRVVIDSRAVGEGDLFVALKGPNHDGHRFVADALGRGAAACMVAEGVAGERLLVVGDTLEGLTLLGRAGRARAKARVVGVTGSVGKTTTKEALRRVLGGFGAVHAGLASHNNHWGVPLTLANLPPDANFAVVEMGMNRAGEIEALTDMARPHVAQVTMVAPAHLAFFEGVEAIARAKAEIFEGLVPGGGAVVNLDAPHAGLLIGAAGRRAGRTVTYGAAEDADLRLTGLDAGPDGSTVDALAFGRPLRFALGLPGRHGAVNALGVLAVVAALGLDIDAAAERLAGLEAGAGRGARRLLPVDGGTALLLDESYNANPASMAAALDTLGRLPGRRIAALGDMLELGHTSPALHEGLLPAVLASGAGLVFTAGPMMRHLHDALSGSRRGAHAPDAAALAPLVRAALRPGDAVLVKGSLGSAMRKVVDALEG